MANEPDLVAKPAKTSFNGVKKQFQMALIGKKLRLKNRHVTNNMNFQKRKHIDILFRNKCGMVLTGVANSLQ